MRNSVVTSYIEHQSQIKKNEHKKDGKGKGRARKGGKDTKKKKHFKEKYDYLTAGSRERRTMQHQFYLRSATIVKLKPCSTGSAITFLLSSTVAVVMLLS